MFRITQDEILLFIIVNIVSILIFSVVYFFLKEITRIKNSKFSNLGIIMTGLGIGILITISSLFFSMYVGRNNSDQNLPNDISKTLINYFILSPSFMMALILSRMIDRRLSIPIIFVIFLGFIILFPWNSINTENSINIEILVIEIVFYIIIFIIMYFKFSITTSVKKNFKKIWLSFFLLLLIIAIKEMIIGIFIWDDKAFKNIFRVLSIIIGYYFLYFIVQIAIIFFIEKLYSNFNKLEVFSMMDNVSFYKMALYQNKLKDFIKEKKINIGILVLIDIKTDNSEINRKILLSIKNLTQLEYKNSFYFKATKNYYGLFFELDEKFNFKNSLINNKNLYRDDKDNLHVISSSLEEISKINNVEIHATSAIYGIQSNSIIELIDYCKFLMMPNVKRANFNNLVVYDFSRVKVRLKERAKVLNLPFKYKDIDIKFIKGISKENIFYPIVSFTNFEPIITLKDLLENIEVKDKETIMRYISYQTLRSFDKKDCSVVIYYPISHLSSDNFNINKFIKKIKRYTLPQKLIIGLNIINEKSNENLIKNINLLKAAKFKFAFINPEKANQKMNDLILPDYLIDVDVPMNPRKVNKKKINFETESTSLNTNLV